MKLLEHYNLGQEVLFETLRQQRFSEDQAMEKVKAQLLVSAALTCSLPLLVIQCLQSYLENHFRCLGFNRYLNETVVVSNALLGPLGSRGSLYYGGGCPGPSVSPKHPSGPHYPGRELWSGLFR